MARIRLETIVHAPIGIVFDVARDIDAHQRSLAHLGERAVGGRTGGRIELGETVTFRARQLGLWWTLTSQVTAFDPPRLFVDEQVRGPFRSFRHEHRFEEAPTGTRMIDVWDHVAPFGVLGRVADSLFLERQMRRLLEARSEAIASEAEAVAAAPGRGTPLRNE